MRTLPTSALALALLAAGCGGASSYDEATPTYDTVSLDMESGSASVSGALDGAVCHPHLFQRTREVVHVLNWHLFKIMGRLDAIISRTATSSTSTSRTWEAVRAGLDLKVTLTKNADGSYAYLGQMKRQSDPDSAFQDVVTGTVTPGAEPHTGQGSLKLDLTALSSLAPAEKATGTITASFDVQGATKTVRVQVADFEPDLAAEVRPPRDANYVFERTAGVGGSLKFREDVVLLCPANPQQQAAQVETVARWTKDGAVMAGRADALATGGQIPAGDRFVGTTCFQLDAGADAEKSWQMKLEDASGATVRAGAVSTAQAGDTGTPCSAVFGAAPTPDSAAGDFDFSSVNFDDASVVPYPGRPATAG
jgi:hypothetical protein